MWVVPDVYRDVVTSSHGVRIFADVLRAGRVIYSGLPVIGGTVAVSSRSVTRRALSCTVPAVLPTGPYTSVPALPGSPTDPLGHYGQEIRLVHALVAPNGSLLPIPVGRFRIDGTSGSELGRTEVTITGVSREAYVADDEFTSPRTESGPSAVAIIRKLILESLPSATVSVLTRRDRRVRPTTWDRDRWGAITELATSIAVQVYTDPTGRFVITDAPTLDTAPVWTFAPKSGASLLDASRSSSRTDVKNLVAVAGATPADATSPIVGIARDDRAESPTRYGDPDAGHFGKAPISLSFPSLATLAECRQVARTELAKRTGAASSLSLDAVPVAALEALDIVDVVTDPDRAHATTHRHIVDSFTLPLTAGGSFPVQTRDLGAAT